MALHHKNSDVERWVCIYPAYINRKKTRDEGRRIPKTKAVDNPSIKEMDDVLSTTGLKYILEPKLYPREKSKEIYVRGRAKIQIKNDDGTPINKDFATRESIMIHLGTLIPKLKSRVSGGKQSGEYPGQQKQESSGGGAGGSGAGGKKKGKKGR